jgi:hypothetical protein
MFSKFYAVCVMRGTLGVMPTLTPAELLEARRASGRLGGRPRKPTLDEARADALERLVPRSIRVLEEHLDSDRPDAWRSAHKILEHAWGRPPDHVQLEIPLDGEIDLKTLTDVELQALKRRLIASAAVNGHLTSGVEKTSTSAS